MKPPDSLLIGRFSNFPAEQTGKAGQLVAKFKPRGTGNQYVAIVIGTCHRSDELTADEIVTALKVVADAFEKAQP